jgi:WD40 repeat protein
MTNPATPLRCPYVGLEPYTEADIDYFFGRERDQRIIAANLVAARLTVLYGASGVGKSSVLLAGVVPNLRTRPRTAVVVVRDWRGAGFLDALKSECGKAVQRVRQDSLSIDPRLSFDDFLCAAGMELRGSLLIIFDQFEEYFLYHPESETGETFDAEFARAVNRDDVDAAFLIVVREDGLAKLDRFGGRIPNLLGNTLRLEHLTAADAEAAIRKPLDVFNERHPDAAPVVIEDALVGAVINQVRSGHVVLDRSGGVGQADRTDETAQIEAPFLQLVMTRLWEEELNSGSRTLRLATLERLGGADKIVRMHLDEVMDGLDGAQQEVCAKFFDRLVTPSGTKIACNLRDLTVFAGPGSSEVAPILETLCTNRILRGVTTPGATSDTSYEIFNDVLAPAILDWRRGYLQAQERTDAERRAAEQAQVAAKARYANRIRNLWMALSVAGVFAIVFLGLWVWELQLQRAALAREAHARELAVAAEDMLEQNPELGILLAIEAVRTTSVADGSVTHSAANFLQWALEQTGLGGHRVSIIDSAANVVYSIIHAPHPEKPLLTLGGVPSTMSFRADGTRLVATSLGPPTSIVDPATQQRVPAWRPTTIIRDSASGLLAPGDKELVTALAISPDAQLVARAGSDGVVRVSDAASDKEIFTPVNNHNSIVTALVFSPDGQQLAARSVDGNVRVSGANSGKELFTLEGQDNKITSFVYSPNGQRLATRGVDGSGRVSDANSGKELFTLGGQSNKIATFVYSPDAKWLAVVGQDRTITVRDAENGSEAFTSAPAQAIAFNANSDLLAILPRDPELKVTLWETHSGKFSPLVGQYRAVAFSPDGKLLAATSQDGLVHLWNTTDAENVKPERTLFRTHSVFDFRFSPDSSKIATLSGDGSTSVWDVGSGTELLSLPSAKASIIVFSPDSTQLAIAGRDGTVSVSNISSQAGKILHIAFSADGRRLATSGDDSGGTVKVWDADNRRLLGIVGSGLGMIYGLAFSPDGRQLVTANDKGDATIWDLKDLKRIHSVVGPSQTGLLNTIEVAWSDGRGPTLASVEFAKIKDQAVGDFFRRLGEPEPRHAVSLSGDGHYLAAVPKDDQHKIEIWNEGAKQAFWSFDAKDIPTRDKDVSFHDIVLSPNGRYVASVSNAGLVYLWDIDSKELRPPLPANYLAHDSVSPETRNSMAFSSDRLAIAYTRTVVVWDITNKGKPMFIHAGDVNSVAFSPDGKRLATASRDGTFEVWPLDERDLIARVRALLTQPRFLKQEECEVYRIEPCPSVLPLGDAE